MCTCLYSTSQCNKLLNTLKGKEAHTITLLFFSALHSRILTPEILAAVTALTPIFGLPIPPGEGNGSPLQCSCLENPRDGGAWWAAVYGVAQSWTQLKRLSSSSSSSNPS